MLSVVPRAMEVYYYGYMSLLLAILFLLAEIFYCVIMDRRGLKLAYRLLICAVVGEIVWADLFLAFLAKIYYPGVWQFPRAMLIEAGLSALAVGICVSVLLVFGMLYRRVRGMPLGALTRDLRLTILSALMLFLTAFSQIIS